MSTGSSSSGLSPEANTGRHTLGYERQRAESVVLRGHNGVVDAVAISPDSHANPFLFGIVARPGEELRRSLRNFAHDRSTPDPLNKRFPVGLMN
jgi:hypothetical protein